MEFILFQICYINKCQYNLIIKFQFQIGNEYERSKEMSTTKETNTDFILFYFSKIKTQSIKFKTILNMCKFTELNLIFEKRNR